MPSDLGPDWEYNGATLTNTASGSSTTAAGVEDGVDVVVDIAVVVDVVTSKSWSVEELQYSPGSPVDLTIGVQNTSNAAAEQLVLQDPQIAEDGATALDPSNPFEYVDYAGLCSPSTLPTGADLVQVDLYVESGGVWNWVTGTPAATPTPPDVSGDVGGVRFTYTSSSGAAISPGGTASEQCVSTTQRAETRDGVTFINGTEVPNTAAGTVLVLGEDPLTTTADDSFVITGLDTVVTAGKSISPSQIAASQSFHVGITGRNDSNGPLDTLTILEPAEPGTFFSEDVTFGGFTGGTWPTTADGATFMWQYSDGSSTIVELEPGQTPPDPTPPDGAYVTGFLTVYRGVLEPGTTAGWDFQVDTSPDLVPDGEDSVTLDNTVQASGVNAAGSDDDTASADVDVFFPTIDVDLDKTIRPSVATPGGEVVVGLQASTPPDGVNVHPNTIVVEDVWDGSEDSFWNAYRVQSITFTDVPAGSTLTVSVARGNPPVWEDVPVLVDATGVVTFDFDDPDSITGVRFTFENPDGFAQGTTVTPNLVFEASDELRTGGPTTEEPGVPVPYDNVATAQAGGDAGGLPVVSPVVPDEATGSIVDYDGTGILPSTRAGVPPR